MRTSRATALAAMAAVTGLVLTACGEDSGGSTDGGSAAGPDGPVTMVVPFSAGGGSDLSGRAMASGLEEVTDSTVTVENITGGSGAVGYGQLLASAGDPSTLLASETSLVTLPIIQDVPYTYDQFTPIMKAGEDYNLVIAGGDSEWETCTDMVEAARDESLTAAVSGTTGPDAIAWTLIEQEESVELQRVPFESTAEVTAALLGDQVQVAAASPGEVIGQLESGDVKALCALAPERYEYEELADIPTGGEQGLDVTFAQWRGLVAAPELDEESTRFWVDAAEEWTTTDSYTEYIESNYLQPQTLFGEDFAEYLVQYDADARSALQP
ncbi:tripartite tricarboxylate transporter substrate binding protein [Pseudokineococcus marinus]|uniref:Tripartite tricarboxylate transporter substrate binding protein n=1 Tax=Pseudokineococcus marinus TaxID=351215 RepID=A0A849BYP8_9ACTN|nr:tripartite tricarboxylate transporter substrate binding protein [Pseudokineococcus marinus]NNH22638.1 tripartite tricarboxylate transporter substrate binding protein [Pseudokineococcus marinus]